MENNVTKKIILLALIAILYLFPMCGGKPVEKKGSIAPPPSPPDAETLIMDAQILASEKNYEKAVEVLNRVVEKEQTNLKALKLLARIYSAIGDRKSSTELWKRIFSLDPSDADAAYEVGYSLSKEKKWSEVRSKMLSFASTGRVDSRHYLLIGEADLELGYKKEAEKYLKLAGKMERAKFLLGKLYYNTGRNSLAEKTFKEVLELNPDHFGSHLHLGWLYYDRGVKSKALEHYREAVRTRPGDTVARLSLAKLLEEAGKIDEAIAEYKRALKPGKERTQEKKNGYISLCNLLIKKGHYQEAQSFINRGLREFPGTAGLYYLWGIILAKQGNKELAIEKFRLSAKDPVWANSANAQIRLLMR